MKRLRNYLDLCRHILESGHERVDRTGTGTISIFGYHMRFDLSEGFPLVTTKDMMAPHPNGNTNLDNIIYELLWFLSGNTNFKWLVDRGVNIWNPDGYRWFKERFPDNPMTYEEFMDMVRNDNQGEETYRWSQVIAGNLGRIYGRQWRSWTTGEMNGNEEYPRTKVIDQISTVIASIKNDPFGRRHLVTAWNPAELHLMALPPCHVMFQFYVSSDEKLSCQLYQRSGDVFLGVPYNIASYALLTMMIADQCGLGYGEFIYTLGDAHIYLNHVEQVKEQLRREPKPLPKMTILAVPKDIFSYRREDFFLSGYDAHPALKGKVSVGL